MAFSLKRPPKEATQAGTEPVPATEPLTKQKEKKPKKEKLPKQKKQKTKKQKSGMKTPTTFVLLIGEDGAILMHIIKGVVEGRWFAPEAKAEHLELFNRAIKDHPKTPLLVLLDTIDQSYVQQNLPPVNKMALGAIMKRRLHREFPNTQLRGSILLGRETGKKEWQFLMVAADESDVVKEWVRWLIETPNHCVGIRLLPLEMEYVLKQLYQKRVEPEKQTHTWLYLLSHHKVSGFRQVILRDGKMVFTRMGQPLQGASDVVAGLIEQEINSTVEYLKRLGLRDVSSMHMHLIASQDILQLVEPARANILTFDRLSPHQAAEILELKGATQTTDRYGDMIMGSAVARQKKYKLNFFTKDIRGLAKLHQIIIGLKGVIALTVLCVVAAIGFYAFESWQQYDKRDSLEQKKRIAEQDLAKAKAEATNIQNAQAVKDVVDIYRLQKEKELSPEKSLIKLSALRSAFAKEMQIRSVSWAFDKDDKTPAPPPSPGKEKAVQVPVSISLSVLFLTQQGETDEQIQQRIQGMKQKIESQLSGYTATISDITGVKSSAESVNLDFSNQKKETEEREITAKISLKGFEEIAPLALGAP